MNNPMTDWISVTRPWRADLAVLDGAVSRTVDAVDNIGFVLVVDGRATLRTGEVPFDLEEGEGLVLVRGSSQQIEVHHAGTVLRGAIGGSRCPVTSLWSGEPDLVHLDADAVAAVPALRPLAALIVAELRTPAAGREPMTAGLFDALLVAMLRAAARGREGGSWLRGLDDPMTRPVLEAVHAAPDEAWTLERLARISGASRSLFARHFAERVGESPMAYVRRWRMSLAAKLLVSDRDRSLESIAQDVGYTSPFAFSRAFKRVLGQSPGRFRRQRSA